MKTKSLLAAFAAALMLTTSVDVTYGQQAPPPRMIGDFSVDAATSAPLRLVKRARLNASPTTVFGLLEKYEAMPKWLPVLSQVTCDRSASGGTNGVGTERFCSLKNGVSVKEAIVGYEAGKLIAYSVSNDNPMGLSNHLAVATVETDGAGGTLLSWRQYFDHAQADQTTAMMDTMIDAGFQKLVKGYGGGAFETSHGLTDMKVVQRLVVDATPEDVWNVLGRDFGGVDKWASFVPKAELSTAAGGGTIRACSTPLGDMREAVTKYDESARQLAYRVEAGLPPIVAEAVNDWDVTPTGDGRSTVVMSLSIKMQDGVPATVAEGVRENFAGVTRNFVDELRHFVETGKPHPRKLAASS